MSDEQSQQASATTATDEPAMTDEYRWGEPISTERQAELDGYLQRWAAEEPSAGGAGHGERAGPDTQGLMPNLHLEILYDNPPL
jgi:hypothetical protein